MRMLKENKKGITLVSLSITIVVLLILVSIGTYSGIEVIKSSKLTTFTTEMKIMQTQVNDIYQKYKDGQAINGLTGNEILTGLGKDITGEVQMQANVVFSSDASGITDQSGYRYFDQSTIQELNIEGVEGEFFVNIETRSVVSYEGFNYDDIIYYTLEQLPNSLYNVEYDRPDEIPTFDISTSVFDAKGNIHISNITNAQYVNKWKVRYRVKSNESENKWNVTEEFTGSEIDVKIPVKNLLDTYEVQVFHGDEIESEIKEVTILKIGDYIDYKPDDAEPYTTLTEQNTGSTSNKNSISQNTLNWQILRVYDDGKMDLIGSAINENIYFKGALGYNNGVYLMNDICKKLYSKESEGITARSVNYEDVEYWLTDVAKSLRDNYWGAAQYGKTKTYIGENTYYPELYAEENGSGINTTTTKTDGIGNSDKTSTSFGDMPTKKTYKQANESGLTVTNIYWKCDINEENLEKGYEALKTENAYWLASRHARCFADYAGFGFKFIDNSKLMEHRIIYSYSYNGTYDGSNRLRPVITLKPSVQITTSNGENTPKNMHTITKY